MHTPHPIRALGSLLAAGALVAGVLVATPAAAAAESDWSSVNTEFVTRDGSRLVLGGDTFRFNGANAYWLGLDENVGGVDYPTFFRIKNALDTAKEMGITVVRSHMMTSTGQDDANPLALMPALGEYNDEAFATIDFAIAYAGSIGLRFILPLTDEWAYYHGGHRDFTTPLGLQPGDFYTDAAAIAAFDDYVEHVLSRTNALTGVRYVDDPTVLAWELGNELEGMTPDWIASQAAFIKERAPHQLLSAGRRFDIDPDTLVAADVDIVDVHYYPPTAAKVAADAATITDAGKVYIAGEYGSNSASADLLGPLVENPDVTGMMLWSLFGHHDRGGYVEHDDGFTLHHPGTTEKMRSQVEAIEAYSEAIGSATGTVELDRPLITEVTTTNGINSVAWRGTAAAATYLVERSVDGAAWSTVAEVPAEGSPVLDLEPAGDVRYRVTAAKADAAGTAVSDTVDVPAGSAVLVDPLETLGLASSSEHVRVVATPVHAQAVADGGDAAITWNVAGASTASFRLDAGSADDLRVASSSDGSDWTDAVLESSTVDGGVLVTASGLSGEQVRVSWAADSGVRLSRATITGVADRPALVDPLDDFSLTAEHTGALSIDGGNPGQFGGDAGRAKRDSADPASLVWTYDDISGADFTAWYWPDQPVIPVAVSASADGSEWTPLEPQVTGGAGNWKRFDYRLRGLEDTDFLRISWDGAQGEPWTPQIGELTLFSPNAPEPAAPGAFALTAPADGATGITASPQLTWSSAADAAYYRVTLARDAGLTDVVEQSAALSAPRHTVTEELAPGTTYHWQVTAFNGYGQTIASPEVATFATAELPTTALTVEDFESYADDAALAAAYPRNGGGGPVTATRIANPVTGTTAASFAYDLSGPGYAGVIRTLPAAQSWWGYDGVEFDAQATPGQTLSVQFVAAGAYWEAAVPVTTGDWTHYEVAFDEFAPPAWAGEGQLDLTKVSQFAFYLGGSGAGTLVIDDVATTLVDAGPQVPVNTAAPSVAGAAVVGGTLTADPGAWDGADLTFSYQWQRDGIDVAGAEEQTYTVTAADQGAEIVVVVTAHRGTASASASSEAVTVVYASSLGLRLSSPVSLSFLTVKATVQLDTAAPTAGRTVTVTVGGKTVTATLDGNGRATLTLPKLKRGVHSVVATFAGDATIAATSTKRVLVILL
ncbi:carbohydrate binding domain-containing protein [Agromyces salentinus]|uniref:mannan endo-1,4-beta-mannosidase n=1 Tax=Agromyces salentinus TaxID=269421 RepID=A0ABP4YTR6_9MICO|nr:carbohydrate binding domain-containing protein [Agromyces salentinus]